MFIICMLKMNQEHLRNHTNDIILGIFIKFCIGLRWPKIKKANLLKTNVTIIVKLQSVCSKIMNDLS